MNDQTVTPAMDLSDYLRDCERALIFTARAFRPAAASRIFAGHKAFGRGVSRSTITIS